MVIGGVRCLREMIREVDGRVSPIRKRDIGVLVNRFRKLEVQLWGKENQRAMAEARVTPEFVRSIDQTRKYRRNQVDKPKKGKRND